MVCVDEFRELFLLHLLFVTLDESLPLTTNFCHIGEVSVELP